MNATVSQKLNINFKTSDQPETGDMKQMLV